MIRWIRLQTGLTVFTNTAASLVSLLALIVMIEYRSDGVFGSESRYEPFHGANFVSTWGVLMPVATLVYLTSRSFMRLSLSVATTTVFLWVLVVAITGSPNWDGENTLLIDSLLVYVVYIPISAGVMARTIYDDIRPRMESAERRLEFVVPLVVFAAFYATVVGVHEWYSQYPTFGEEFKDAWVGLLVGFLAVLAGVHAMQYCIECRVVRTRLARLAEAQAPVDVKQKAVARHRQPTGTRMIFSSPMSANARVLKIVR